MMVCRRRLPGAGPVRYLGLSYTWSKTINYADNDQGPRIQFLPAKERNRGLAGYDRTHNLQMHGVYDLPFGKGQRWAREGWASAVFGGFQVSGVVSIMSGMPFYVIQGSAPNLLAGGSGQVPNQLNPKSEFWMELGLRRSAVRRLDHGSTIPYLE